MVKSYEVLRSRMGHKRRAANEAHTARMLRGLERSNMANRGSLHRSDVEWFLDSESALGARSNLAGIIHTIEAGGSHGLPSDLPAAAGAVDAHQCERQRRYRRAWESIRHTAEGFWMLDPQEWSWWLQRGMHPQRVLLARYKLNLRCEVGGFHLAWPPGWESTFGQCSGVAALLAADEGILERVIPDARNGVERALSPLRRRAGEAIRAAHRAWADSLQKVDYADTREWLLTRRDPCSEAMNAGFH